MCEKFIKKLITLTINDSYRINHHVEILSYYFLNGYTH